MKLIVFGASGLFGTEVEHACNRRGMDVLPLYRSEVDIGDPVAIHELLIKNQTDIIVNAAGMIDIGQCELDPEKAFRLHCLAVIAMAKAVAETGAVFVQTGTHLVFDGTADRPYDERDAANPGTVYAATKFAAETLALARCSRCYAVRFPTLYGTRRNSARGFVERMTAALKRGESVRVADDRIDTTTYAADAAEAVLDLASSSRPSGIYHVANAGSHSYFDFVEELNRQLGTPGTVVRAKDADFRKTIEKPLRVPIVSNKLPTMRPWQEALADYQKHAN